MKHPILLTILTTLLAACGSHGGGGGDQSPPSSPSDLTYPNPLTTYLVQVEIEENAPEVKGKVTSWSVVPSLPAGLALHPSTGVLSGTPLSEKDRTLYVVTATGPGGETSSELDLEVVLPARFAYTPGEDDTIGIYTVEPYSGDLRFHGLQYHEAPDSGPEQVAIHPSGRFVYVPNRGEVQKSSTITAYSVDTSDGSLHLIGHTAIGEGPHWLKLRPDGKTLYGISFAEHSIHVYSVDQLTGSLTEQQVVPTNTGPERMEVDPFGRFIFVSHRPSADIAVFTIHPDGTLTNDVGGYNYYAFIPSDVAVDRQGLFAYFVFEVTNTLVSYKIDQATGALMDQEEVQTSGVPSDVTLHPRGEMAYVACKDAGTIDLFALDPIHGGGTLIETYDAGLLPIAINFDPSGRQLYALSDGSNQVQSFAVDPKSGLLTPLGIVRTRAAAVDIAVLRGDSPALPREEFLYVVNSESDDVAGFTIEVQSGSLTSTGSNALTGDSPGAVAVDPRGRFIWVANAVDQSISIFSITPGSGALASNVPDYDLGQTPGGVAVDPSSLYLYVSLRDSDEVAGFRIGANGELTEVDRATTGTAPARVSIDPTGQFVYTSNVGGTAHSVSAFRVLKGQFLSSREDEVAPGHPGQLRFAPDGDFAYLTLKNSRLVVPYAVDSETGALTVQASGSIPVSARPNAVALTPDGRFAYAAVPGGPNEDGFVARFLVDPLSGGLTLLGETSEGLSPQDLTVGPTGRFLYVANAGGDDLTVFEIDAASGDLTVLDSVASGLSPEALILATRVD